MIAAQQFADALNREVKERAWREIASRREALAHVKHNVDRNLWLTSGLATQEDMRRQVEALAMDLSSTQFGGELCADAQYEHEVRTGSVFGFSDAHRFAALYADVYELVEEALEEWEIAS